MGGAEGGSSLLIVTDAAEESDARARRRARVRRERGTSDPGVNRVEGLSGERAEYDYYLNSE